MAYRSPLTRALRAFTALVTVWCLGCSAFEPLLAGLTGESGGFGMSCASEPGREGLSTVVTAGGGGAMTVDAPSTENSPDDCLCQCQGCHAPSPNAIEVILERLAPPSLPSAGPDAFLSVARQPLVPPPQRSL